MLDLGCGRGISTSWFITHGLEYVVCAGSCLAAGWKLKLTGTKPVLFVSTNRGIPRRGDSESAAENTQGSGRNNF